MKSDLHENEKFLQLVLNNIPSYVFWKDAESTYVGCNSNFAISAGLNNPGEIVGKSDYEMAWSKEDSDFYRKIDKEVMESGESQINFEEPQNLDDGTMKWLRTSKIPLRNAEGKVIGILGAYEDITKRKSMELELVSKNEHLMELNSKLEMINIDLEQFAYSTSHDLQEPLRMIGGFVGLLEKKYKDKLDEQGTEYFKYVKEGTTRMSNLISQILSYSKIENNEDHFVETDLGLLMQDVLEDLSAVIEEKKVQVDINLPVEKVLCQPGRIKMLLYNLLNNGIKFNESDAPTIKINFEERDDIWLFHVVDNGIGIDEKYEEQIFKPFQRLNSRTKFPGNGLGLSICKRIVYLHGGEINYNRNKHGGTTFNFSLNKVRV